MRIFPHHQHRPPHKHRRRLAIGLALAVAGTWLAPTFAASSDTWDRLAQCESGRRWNADTGNGYYGGLQFSTGTWRAYGGAEFAPRAHRATREQQITVAERLLADRGWGPWPGCAAKLKLTPAHAVGSPHDAALAAAEKKATNTAARYQKKLAVAELAQYKYERAIRKARLAAPEPKAKRAKRSTTIQRLRAEAGVAAEKAAIARAGADRAARKLAAVRAAEAPRG